MNLEYKDKYLKYKSKYNKLKTQIGTGKVKNLIDCENIFNACKKKDDDNKLLDENSKKRYLENACFSEFKECQKNFRKAQQALKLHEEQQNKSGNIYSDTVNEIIRKANVDKDLKGLAQHFRDCDGTKDGFCCYNWVKEFLINKKEITDNIEELISKMDGTVKFNNKLVERRIMTELEKYNVKPPCTKFDIVEMAEKELN